jgi:hypothetical protein
MSELPDRSVRELACLVSEIAAVPPKGRLPVLFDLSLRHLRNYLIQSLYFAFEAPGGTLDGQTASVNETRRRKASIIGCMSIDETPETCNQGSHAIEATMSSASNVSHPLQAPFSNEEVPSILIE